MRKKLYLECFAFGSMENLDNHLAFLVLTLIHNGVKPSCQQPPMFQLGKRSCVICLFAHLLTLCQHLLHQWKLKSQQTAVNWVIPWERILCILVCYCFKMSKPCPTLRLEVTSLPAGCIRPVTIKHVRISAIPYYTHVLWRLAWSKQSTGSDVTSNLGIGQSLRYSYSFEISWK